MIPVNEIFERFPEVKQQFYMELNERSIESRKLIEEDVNRGREFESKRLLNGLMDIMKYDPMHRRYLIDDFDLAKNRKVSDAVSKYMKENGR